MGRYLIRKQIGLDPLTTEYGYFNKDKQIEFWIWHESGPKFFVSQKNVKDTKIFETMQLAEDFIKEESESQILRDPIYG